MRLLVIAPRAQADLNGISDYLLRTAGPAAAARVVAELHSAMTRLADESAMGHPRPDRTGQPVLFHLALSYYVIHRADPGGPLEVARVLHAARDMPSILT